MRDDDRVAIGWTQPRVQADGLAMIDQPARCRFDFGAVMALGGNAGEAEVVAQFADEAGFVFAKVIDDVLHGAPVCKRGVICQEMRNDVFRDQRPADMRGDCDVRIVPERMPRRKRFGGGGIQMDTSK